MAMDGNPNNWIVAFEEAHSKANEGQAPGASDTEGVQRAHDWNDDKLRRERELYEGCVSRKALARALGQSTDSLALMGVLGGPSGSCSGSASRAAVAEMCELPPKVSYSSR